REAGKGGTGLVNGEAYALPGVTALTVFYFQIDIVISVRHRVGVDGTGICHRPRQIQHGDSRRVLFTEKFVVVPGGVAIGELDLAVNHAVCLRGNDVRWDRILRPVSNDD